MAICADGDYVYSAGRDEYYGVYVVRRSLDLTTWESIAVIPLDYPAYPASIAVWSGNIYVGSTAGKIYSCPVPA